MAIKRYEADKAGNGPTTLSNSSDKKERFNQILASPKRPGTGRQ